MENLEGKKFGKLIAKKPIKEQGKNIRWLCICECKNTCTPYAWALKSGHTTSCGCLRKERIGNTRKHGMINTRIYHCWEHMKDKCNNQFSNAYKNYGGKGIKVCEEWENNFISFYNWSVENGYSDELSIELIDKSYNFSPENCRWVKKYIRKNVTKGL